MAFSLYDATVANYLQILGAVGGFLDDFFELFLGNRRFGRLIGLSRQDRSGQHHKCDGHGTKASHESSSS